MARKVQGLPWRRKRLPLIALFVAAVIALFLYLNIPLTLEWVVLILCVAAILSGVGLLFIKDWGAFILVLFAWQITAPLAKQLPFPWHVTEPIAADRFLFGGHVPALWLQLHMYHPGVLEPWDVLAAVMYMLHFVTPLLAGFVLWLTNRELFHKYSLAFVLVAIAGYITWIVYPMAPPWIASEHLRHVGHIYLRSPGGTVYLPGVRNLFDVFARHWYNAYNGNITIGFLHGHVDQIAAMPSEHAAFPMLFFLFLRRQFGKPAYLLLIYLAALTFSIMYLGQHYFVDAVAGYLYAAGAYACAVYLLPRLYRRSPRLRPTLAFAWSRHKTQDDRPG